MKLANLMSINDVARLLGISVSGIYAWVSQKRIPYIKIGRAIRFDSDDISRWLSDKKTKVGLN